MKPNVLLVSDSSADSNGVIADAAAQTGRGLRQIKSSREAFEVLKAGLEHSDVLIIDLDPGIHSLSVLEAIGYCEAAPPVIVVTGLEESGMTPIAYRHGAAACIAKPFNAAELASLIKEVGSSASQVETTTCDIWGHPRMRPKPASRIRAA
jgi:DNA-binding NtrC family response regulator